MDLMKMSSMQYLGFALLNPLALIDSKIDNYVTFDDETCSRRLFYERKNRVT